MVKSDGARQCRAVTIYIIAALQYIVVFFHRLVTASLTQEIKKRFGLEDGELSQVTGTFSALYFYFYAFLQPFVGIIVDALKPRWTIVIAGILMSIGSLLLGVVANISVAYVGRALIGIGAAFVYVPVLKLISLWFPAQKFALLTGIMVALGGLGGFLCTAPLSLAIEAIAKGSGDQSGIFSGIFYAASAVSVILTIAFVFLARDSPEKAGYAPLPLTVPSKPGEEKMGNATTAASAKSRELDPAAHGHADTNIEIITADGQDNGHDFRCKATEETSSIPRKTTMEVPASQHVSTAAAVQQGEAKKSCGREFCNSLSLVFCAPNSKYLILMMCAYFFCVGSYFTISASIGVDLITKTISSTESASALKLQATWVQAGLNLGTIVGSPLQSALANLIGRKPMQLINVAIMFLVYVGIAVVKQVRPAIWSYTILYILVGIVGGTMIVVAYTNIKELFLLSVSGTAIGFFNVAPFLGAAVFQNLAPVLLKAGGAISGYENMCYLFMANSVVAFVILLFSRETAMRRVPNNGSTGNSQ